MFPRKLIWAIAAVAVISLDLCISASARTAMTRQEIRSMPITVRPNRPGHFYGNTVRRTVQRRG